MSEGGNLIDPTSFSHPCFYTASADLPGCLRAFPWTGTSNSIWSGTFRALIWHGGGFFFRDDPGDEKVRSEWFAPQFAVSMLSGRKFSP